MNAYATCNDIRMSESLGETKWHDKDFIVHCAPGYYQPYKQSIQGRV